MATLTDGVKRFIVQALACYDTPSQVAEAVKQEFGIETTRMQVSAYDPTKAMGKSLSKQWRVLFDDTRKQFIEESTNIPIANKNFRLRALNRMLTQTESRGNVPLAAQLLEQAAKEMGEAYTNKNRTDPADQVPPTPVRVEIAVTDARVPHDDNQPDS